MAARFSRSATIDDNAWASAPGSRSGTISPSTPLTTTDPLAAVVTIGNPLAIASKMDVADPSASEGRQ
jgi:hypothetical protein